ncbi:MAG: tripeptide aminopeptidase PepT, partial [Rikenellaceae bacterium]
MENLAERFIRYTKIHTESCSESETFPSTEGQIGMLEMLACELRAMGVQEVEMDANGYVTGKIPATIRKKIPVVGFIAHVDTSEDMTGKSVNPQIIECYDGKDILLGGDVVMKVTDFPQLSGYVGQTLITTDGTTLLGADDKAGVAEIMCAAEYLIAHPEIEHGEIRIGFTPDEEIGRGVDFFDV